ncbi:MAG: DASS family sodium-coupled anion symporter [Verrucomicrobiota bacterium]
MGDTRSLGRRILGKYRFSLPLALTKAILCATVALLVAAAPEYFQWESAANLSLAGKRMLTILIFAAGLWITEAFPAFAVSLLVMALQIAILGRPGGAFTEEGDTENWRLFLAPWSSPLIWLFLGGFVLASAAVQTKLDITVARAVIQRFGTRPKNLLAGAMLTTFLLSMFMSNTATAAMMIAALTPVVTGLGETEKSFGKGLLLGIAMAAAVGGMGTIIGTPPNAIAVGNLAPESQVDFLRWMTIGFPPALALTAFAWFYLTKRYPSHAEQVDIAFLSGSKRAEEAALEPLVRRHRKIVLVIFAAVITAWMTESLHHISAAVISFFAIAALAVSGVVNADQMRTLPWDVLILMAGGLSLGVGVTETGLAQWLTTLIPPDLPEPLLIIAIIYLAVIMSNVMSNTAAAAILIPIAAGLPGGDSARLLAPIALASSCAMILPVSTPPNAIAFASKKLRSSDFAPGGLLIAALGPIVCYAWCWIVAR